MKEAVTKVIDTLTQEDFHGAFQKLLERYNKRLLRRGLELHVCTINESAHTKKSGNLFNDPRKFNLYQNYWWFFISSVDNVLQSNFQLLSLYLSTNSK